MNFMVAVPRMLCPGYFAWDAVRAGAWAYVSELEDAVDLQGAICSLVESHGSPLLKQIASSDEGAAMLLHWFTATREKNDDSEEVPNPLNVNEIKILDLVARGEPSKVIGHIVRPQHSPTLFDSLY